MTTRPSARERILEAARQVIAAQGPRSATVQDILDAAGVSRRTFYQHFRSQEDVLHTLFDDGARDLEQAMLEAISATDDPAEQVVAAVDAYLDFQLRGGSLTIVLQASAIGPESLLAPSRERTLDALVDHVDRAIASVVGVQVDPLVWRTLLIGIEGLVIHCQRGGEFTEADRDRVRRVILPVFRAVLASFPYLPTVQT